MTVAHVQDVLNKKHQVTQVFVTFSGPVSENGADSTATYRLATPGKGGSYTASNAGIIKLKSARYNGATLQVTLTPRTPFDLTKPVQLRVYGTGPSTLYDAEGRPIDGNHDGIAGGDAVAILSRKSTVIQAEIQGTGRRSRAGIHAVIDAVLDRHRSIKVGPGHGSTRRH